MRSVRGKLLVATPTLLDPNFARTVVLVLEHNAEGALGLVLNRPSSTSLLDALPQWWPVADEPAVVFVGGPVSPQSAIGLAATEPVGEPVGFAPLDGAFPSPDAALGTVDLEQQPEAVAPTVRRLRVFAGYAGWGPTQLDGELAMGSWFVVDAWPGDPWTDEPGDLWRTVLARQSGRLKIFSRFPDDPSAN